MRKYSWLFAAALFAACAPAKEAEPVAEAPPVPAIADFAGTWNSTATLTGVANPVPSTMTVTADGVGSTITMEGRVAIPVTISMMGDSLVAVSAEYESILRKGVMVSTRTAAVLDGGMMKGSLIATYKSTAGPEMVMGTIESHRAP